MGRICCLIGKSASGKDTVYRELLKDPVFSFQPIVLYTTRPIRGGEVNGREYHFVTDEKLQKFERQGKVIERRDYHTVQGIWSYATIDDGEIRPEFENYLAIATVASFAALRSYFGAEKVEPFYLEIDDGIRLERALERERQQARPDYAELCRRYLADREDFSEEKLIRAGILRRFDNEKLADCMEEIKVHLLSLL